MTSAAALIPATEKLRQLCDRRGWKVEYRDDDGVFAPVRELRVTGKDFADVRFFGSVTATLEPEAADERLASKALVVLVFAEWGVEYPSGLIL